MKMNAGVTSFFEGDGRRLLRALSRPAAYVDALDMRNGQVEVQRASGAGHVQRKAFSQAIWTKAVSLNFVCKSDRDRRWRLSETGRLALRKALSGGSEAPASGCVGVGTKKKTPPPSSACQRMPKVDDHESPLAWLAKRKSPDGVPLLRPSQFAAGERLREDFWRAHLNQRVTMDWSRALSGGGRRHGAGAVPDLSDAAMAARERVNAAMAAVGPELSGILIDVCCYLKGLSVAERQAGWPQRSAKVVLLLALTRLARHYGLERDTSRAADARGVVQHWGHADYRPDIG
jgi:Domain of unknown function (DUF6456)